jgi:D-sedoheptulose 7-phosphate isomerase
MRRHVEAALDAAADAMRALRSDEETLTAIEAGGLAIAGTLERGGRVLACGNGGSLCDAMHFAEELSGSFRRERAPLPVAAIADAAHLTCVANDFGYERVFARYVEGHLRDGDLLVALSTSGRSPNIVAAAEAARAQGARVVALSGQRDCALAGVADIHVCTPGGEWSDRVQELHIKVLHIFVEIVERRLFPEGYAE